MYAFGYTIPIPHPFCKDLSFGFILSRRSPLPPSATPLVQAVEYLQQAVAFDDKDGHTWEELAYCYLMINDLQNSYTAYQHALYHIQNPKVGSVGTSRCFAAAPLTASTNVVWPRTFVPEFAVKASESVTDALVRVREP